MVRKTAVLTLASLLERKWAKVGISLADNIAGGNISKRL